MTEWTAFYSHLSSFSNWFPTTFLYTNILCIDYIQNMTKCPACNYDYDEGDLERHLEMYDVTTKENLAKYLAYLKHRIDALEAALPRPKPEP